MTIAPARRLANLLVEASEALQGRVRRPLRELVHEIDKTAARLHALAAAADPTPMLKR